MHCFFCYSTAARGATAPPQDYLVFDRHQLGYLNFFERFHCTYCAYGSGLLAYCSEIVARTEQYFCPIKHARKIRGTHARYVLFLAFGDADDYEENLGIFTQLGAIDTDAANALGHVYTRSHRPQEVRRVAAAPSHSRRADRLANRWLFRYQLEQDIARASRSGLSVAVHFLDLDYFKNINDSYGHPAGDALLAQVSGRIHVRGQF